MVLHAVQQGGRYHDAGYTGCSSVETSMGHHLLGDIGNGNYCEPLASHIDEHKNLFQIKKGRRNGVIG